MKRSTSRWIVGLSTGAILHVGIYWALVLIQSSSPENPPARSAGAKLSYLGKDQVEYSPIMRQQIELFDPKPLMQPTQWNVANLDREGPPVGDNLEIFLDYDPTYGTEQGDLSAVFGNPWPAGREAEDVFIGFAETPTLAFGRVSKERRADIDRGIEIEIVEMRSGRSMLRDVVANLATEEIQGLSGDWGSASFIVQILDSFLAGMPIVDESSGNREADRILSSLLGSGLMPRGRLSDGFYSVRISR